MMGLPRTDIFSHFPFCVLALARAADEKQAKRTSKGVRCLLHPVPLQDATAICAWE